MKIFVTLLIAAIGIGCMSSDKKETAPEPAPAQTHHVKPIDTPAPAHPQGPNVTVEHTQWSYSGLTGPEMWGDIKPEFKSCKAGTHQSPIDLVWRKPTKKGDIEFNYNDSEYKIVDNGHTVKAIFNPGNTVKIRVSSEISSPAAV